MERSLRCGRRVTLPHVGLFADGVAVKQVGVETFRLARRYVDEMVLVDTDELCAAIKDVFEDTRAIVEPPGRSASPARSATSPSEGSPAATSSPSSAART